MGGTEAVGEVEVDGEVVGDVVLMLELGVPTSPPIGISVGRLHASRQTKGRAKHAKAEARYAVFKRLSVDAADVARLDGDGGHSRGARQVQAVSVESQIARQEIVTTAEDSYGGILDGLRLRNSPRRTQAQSRNGMSKGRRPSLRSKE